MAQHDEPAPSTGNEPNPDNTHTTTNRPTRPAHSGPWPPSIPRNQHARPPRSSRALIAAGIGTSLGAISLIAYGFTIRVPHGGRAADTMAPVTEFFVWYLVLGSLTAVAVLGIGISALLGRTVNYAAATLLAFTVAVSAWSYISSVPASIAIRVSGFGAQPAPELAKLAWPLLMLAAMLVLAGSVWAINTRQSIGRSMLTLLSPWTAAGIAVSLAAGLAVTQWWWPHTQTHPATTERIAIAALPTMAGSRVAYSIPVYDPDQIVPAGPGFLTYEQGGGITAFNTATGAPRWTVPPAAFPKDCGLDTVRSTGITDTSVVIAQCTRPQLHKIAPVSPNNEPVLMGFDANTGEPLWLNDDGFELPYGAGLSDTVTAVIRREEEVGSLDPRTGTVRWVKPNDRDPCARTVHVINSDIVLTPCYGNTDVRVLDGDSGQQRTINLLVYVPSNRSDLSFETLAVDAGLLILQSRRQVRASGYNGTRDEYGTWAIDIENDRVTAVPSVIGGADSPIPGPLLQLDSHTGPEGSWVEVYSLAQRRLVRVGGFSLASITLVGGYAWAQIGDHKVTAAARDRESDYFIASVAPDDSVIRTPSPCPQRQFGGRGAGIMAVPGATLVLCPPLDDDIHHWDILGMR